MSRTNPTKNEELALEIDCYCNPRGTWCVTYSGKWATWLHAFRTHPVYTAMGIAYEECDGQHQRDIARRAERLREELSRYGVDQRVIEDAVAPVMDRKWFW